MTLRLHALTFTSSYGSYEYDPILFSSKQSRIASPPVLDIFASTTDVDDGSQHDGVISGGRLARRLDDDGYLMMKRSKLMIVQTVLYSRKHAGCIVAAQEGQCRYVKQVSRRN